MLPPRSVELQPHLGAELSRGAQHEEHRLARDDARLLEPELRGVPTAIDTAGLRRKTSLAPWRPGPTPSPPASSCSAAAAFRCLPRRRRNAPLPIVQVAADARQRAGKVRDGLSAPRRARRPRPATPLRSGCPPPAIRFGSALDHELHRRTERSLVGVAKRKPRSVSRSPASSTRPR